MDVVKIEKLELFGYHGVNVEENILGQKFLINLSLYLDAGDACKSDSLSDTVNYAEVYLEIKKVVEVAKFKLIERVADEICRVVFLNFEKVLKVDIEVQKPNVPINWNCKGVGVSFTRERSKYLQEQG